METRNDTGSRFKEIIDNLTPDHIRRPLYEAREIGQDTFRRQQQAWAAEHWPQLKRVTEELFTTTEINRHGITNVEAALVGTLLGGAVVRALAEDGVVKLDECRTNLEAQLGPDKGIFYNGKDVTDEALVGFLGEDTAEALTEIAHPAARTMCAAVIGLAVLPPDVSEAQFDQEL